MALLIASLVACAGLPAAFAGLPPYSRELGERLWEEAKAAVGSGAGAQASVCGGGTWGDSGQVDQWDTGRSPCWPSTMTISASWDPKLMARWSVELAEEFGGAGRGQLGPGINIARFPWNGRLGEYMSGEDPYFGARMVEAQVAAYRTVDHPPLQVVKHFIPNTIENRRTDMIEVVDERTLFELYYPQFEAAINAGVSAVMCSYNAVKCTTGMCSGEAAYACANDDTLNKHLKETLGFRGIVMSDWDATKCRGEAGSTKGCTPGQYIANDVAAAGGLDLEMPSCMTFAGGVTIRAEEKAARMHWAYAVQGQTAPARRLSAENTTAPVRSLRATEEHKPNPHGEYCCWWPQKGDNVCAVCQNKGKTTPKDKCAKGHGVWCDPRTMSTAAAPPPAAPTAAPTAPAPAPASSPDWTSGVYSDNPFGDAAPSAPAPVAAAPANFGTGDVPPLDALTDDRCADLGSSNVKSPCKLALADKIIVESTVVLKNEGGVLPLTKDKKVALIGKEACASDPLAIGGGSGWNGPSCNQVTKINVKTGIEGLTKGPGNLACPDGADGGSSVAADADVIVAVVVPTKASEGTDRETLQLHAADVALIKKYAAMGKPVVVAMNAPGPMITNTFDKDIAAMIVSWLPGQQNGRGIAMALYNEGYEASGRLPFTFPKCRTEACSKEDEFASAPLGDKIAGNAYYNFEEKQLIGYRWYHANGVEVNYPFGFGLVAYGSAELTYSEATASVDSVNSLVEVSCRVEHSGPVAGHEVMQLYLSFPDDVPGDAEDKPEWVLKGFGKWKLEPNSPQVATFSLTKRDLSYWDDGPGASQWVCAKGSFSVCIGPNARDAIVPGKGTCTTFASPCGSSTQVDELIMQKNAAADPAVIERTPPLMGAFAAFLAAAAMAFVTVAVRRRLSSQGYDQVLPLVPAASEEFERAAAPEA